MRQDYHNVDKETVFRRIPQDKIALNIVKQVREAILKGELQSGDRLPPEKELLAQFGVGRHTFREAMRALEVLGLIAIQKGAGGGAIVMEIDLKTIQEYIATFLRFNTVTISDLCEVRKLIEPYLARLAAERLRPQDLARMEAVNQTILKARSRGDRLLGSRNDIEFHHILAQASGNSVWILVLNVVQTMLRESKLYLWPGLNFSRDVVAGHQHILEALNARDGKRAADEMYRHVCTMQEELEANLELHAVKEDWNFV